MKVDLTNGVSNQNPVELNSRPATTSSSAAAPAETQDRTTLSTSSSAVSTLVSQAMASPEVRQDKVSALKQQIASGNYNINPSKIASGILSEGM
ncbi:anti-sigma-28 factor, FlgM family [Bryocella elongata]|uniref:Negative regulator of flagellin synthesis n=1 Tax=Bryocella elongata TaxID=863522 RepID=A0A1H5TKH0_9BACT|nr:flagellar biosynthesis anti-sigma factor FlgM [Bryocella elongata]SEF63264.1 anti-sigma-28 factor, FlgM family [Bryocella elongata]